MSVINALVAVEIEPKWNVKKGMREVYKAHAGRNRTKVEC